MRDLQSQMLIWIIMISTIVQQGTVHQNKAPSPEDSQQAMTLRLQQKFQPLSSGVAPSGDGSVRVFSAQGPPMSYEYRGTMCYELLAQNYSLLVWVLGFARTRGFISKVLVRSPTGSEAPQTAHSAHNVSGID